MKYRIRLSIRKMAIALAQRCFPYHKEGEFVRFYIKPKLVIELRINDKQVPDVAWRRSVGSPLVKKSK